MEVKTTSINENAVQVVHHDFPTCFVHVATASRLTCFGTILSSGLVCPHSEWMAQNFRALFQNNIDEF